MFQTLAKSVIARASVIQVGRSLRDRILLQRLDENVALGHGCNPIPGSTG
jgi:hypothetical protein